MKNLERMSLGFLLLMVFSFPLFLQSKGQDEGQAPSKGGNHLEKHPIVLPNYIQLAGSEGEIQFDEYVMGVVAAEMPASYHMEALKAQAIAARTYALVQTDYLKKPIEVTTRHQVYFPVNNLSEQYAKKVKEAVSSTKQMILLYEGKPISAMFHAASNGMTESSYNFSGSERAYLQSVPSPEEKLTTHRFSLSEVNHLLQTKFTLNDVKNAKLERNNTNRIERVEIGNLSWSGREFREKLSLASTDFTIQIIDGNVQMVASGYGHGVGMSQQGANELAQQGYSYEEILQHYYGDVVLAKYEEKAE